MSRSVITLPSSVGRGTAVFRATATESVGSMNSSVVTSMSPFAAAPRAGRATRSRSARADAEARVVALGLAVRVVGVREDRDAPRLRRLVHVEELLVVLADIHTLLDPGALALSSARPSRAETRPAATTRRAPDSGSGPTRTASQPGSPAPSTTRAGTADRPPPARYKRRGPHPSAPSSSRETLPPSTWKNHR